MKTFLKYNKYQWIISIGFLSSGAFFMKSFSGHHTAYLFLAFLSYSLASSYLDDLKDL